MVGSSFLIYRGFGYMVLVEHREGRDYYFIEHITQHAMGIGQ